MNGVRRIENIFPGLGVGSAKHDHYRDFGFPTHLDFHDFYQMYQRNGLAAGAVEQTALETWQDFPQVCETEDADETPLEVEIRRHFEKIRFWQRVADVDRKSMIGRYSALILRFADNKPFMEPAENIRSGIQALVEVIPVWEGQLQVSSWHDDQRDPRYGQPKMFNFNEANVTEPSQQQKNRAFEVHPSRVIVWSRDGTIHGQSKLEAGFNDLMTMEKIVGAGGEGFWKNATGRPILETDKEVKIDDIARGMGVTVDEVADKMDEQVADFNKGFDQMLMLQGIKAKTLPVNMISPEHPFNVALNSFCASWPIPAKKLVGAQTGERASGEDNDSWKMTNNSRRTNIAKPTIMSFLERLIEVGILEEKDWSIKWTDLTETSMSEKIERAGKMAEINAKQPDEQVFLVDEIREVVGMLPSDLLDDEDDGDDDLEPDEVDDEDGEDTEEE